MASPLRLLRVGKPGQERPCLMATDGIIRDVSGWLRDWAGECLAPAFLASIAARFEHDAERLPVVDSERVGPVVQPRQIISIGLNYRKHAAAAGMAVPSEPIVSSKSVHALAGPFDDLLIPLGSEHTDWEVELAVVMGRRAQYLSSPAVASQYIAGYCTANDVSDRRWLLERGGEWLKGKSFQSFAPLGPHLLPASHFDPAGARLTCRVNGQPMQDDTTADMIFSIPEIVHYLSRCMILEPGDVILTGSPAGMAYGRPGQPYLRPGDVLQAEVCGLGAQRQHCRRHETDEGTRRA